MKPLSVCSRPTARLWCQWKEHPKHPKGAWDCQEGEALFVYTWGYKAHRSTQQQNTAVRVPEWDDGSLLSACWHGRGLPRQ